VIERSQFVSWRVEQFMTREVGVDTVGGPLAVADAIVAVRSEGNRVASGEDAVARRGHRH